MNTFVAVLDSDGAVIGAQFMTAAAFAETEFTVYRDRWNQVMLRRIHPSKG